MATGKWGIAASTQLDITHWRGRLQTKTSLACHPRSRAWAVS